MFNFNVNQTYNQQDATLEILIMLVGAFLLGGILCWLIKKLIHRNKQETLITKKNSSNYINKDIATPAQSLTIDTNNSQRLVSKKQVSNSYSIPKIDDLTKISGINPEIENELRTRGIKSYIDLRDNNKQAIIDTLGSSHGQVISAKEAQTWPHQASLAAKGEWEKLQEYQDFMTRTKKAAEKIKKESESIDLKVKSESKIDDLKKIEGIGPKIEEILNKNGIYTYEVLSKVNRDMLKSYLNQAGDRFKMHEPESWPYQAGMAATGQWEELKIYQEFMDTGSEVPAKSTIDKLSKNTTIDSKKYNTKATKQLAHDDLKKIEGIGPKIEEVLNKKGITTFAKLHETDRDTLKSYLDQAGNQFKMHEPESWPHQAGMAATGQWEELKIYQEFMDGGREVPSASTSLKINDSKSSNSLFIKDTTTKVDDLKKIEGIGPKIQELLNNAGIRTYKDLGNSNRDTIKKLLDTAGPQYRMHEPETWPAQAKLADKGEWETLKQYQEKIINGRAK